MIWSAGGLNRSEDAGSFLLVTLIPMLGFWVFFFTTFQMFYTVLFKTLIVLIH